MNLWDVGGQAKHRPFWRHYYTGTEGLIFVVDASDSQRIEEASEELRTALSDNQLAAAAILISEACRRVADISELLPSGRGEGVESPEGSA